MKNKWIFLFGTIGLLSYEEIVQKCDQGVFQKPSLLTSLPIKSPEGKVAISETRCWKEGDRHLAASDLLIDKQKVYFTPGNAFTAPCGSAAGEIFKPFQWSPDGHYLAWEFIPYCWETEPIPTVIMIYQAKEKKNFAPKLDGIAKEFYKRYPKALPFKEEISFVSQPVKWISANKLLLEVGVICYGCTLDVPATQWSVTPDEKVTFIGSKD